MAWVSTLNYARGIKFTQGNVKWAKFFPGIWFCAFSPSLLCPSFSPISDSRMAMKWNVRRDCDIGGKVFIHIVHERNELTTSRLIYVSLLFITVQPKTQFFNWNTADIQYYVSFRYILHNDFIFARYEVIIMKSLIIICPNTRVLQYYWTYF